MTDQLFTAICEFKGGTYISQVHGRDEQDAFAAWIDVLRRDRPMGEQADWIANEAADDTDPLTALRDLSGVWCWTANVAGHLTITNIVRSA